MTKKYRGNDNRIVRIFNDEIFTMIDLVAEYLDVPTQHVFDVFCEMFISGDKITLDNLVRMSRVHDEIIGD